MENDTPRRMPNVPPFVKFVCANVPMVFDDSLSYYEALCALWKYVQSMTDVINNNATLEEEYIEKFNVLSGKFDQLKIWVETYFDNLDVQEEINNKLDEMAEEGYFDEILDEYFSKKINYIFPKYSANGSSEWNLIQIVDKNTTKWIMIDCGLGSSWSTLMQMLTDYGITHLDMFIISHYDADHIGNVQNLVTYHFIDRDTVVYTPAQYGFNDAYIAQIAATNLIFTTANINYRTPDELEKINYNGLSLTFANTDPDIISEYTYQRLNNSCSSVVLFEYGSTSAFFSGDATKVVLERLYKEGFPKRTVNLYKIPHHGIDYVSSVEFTNMIKPDYAVQVCNASEFSINNLGICPETRVLKELNTNMYLTFMNKDYIEFESSINSFECMQGINYGVSASQITKDLYVDHSIDATDYQNGESYAPFKEIEQALSAIQTYNATVINIHVAAGYYSYAHGDDHADNKNLLHVYTGKGVVVNITGTDDPNDVWIHGATVHNSIVNFNNVTFDCKYRNGLYSYYSDIEFSNVVFDTSDNNVSTNSCLIARNHSNITNLGGLTLKNGNELLILQRASIFKNASTLTLGAYTTSQIGASADSRLVNLTKSNVAFETSADAENFDRYYIEAPSAKNILDSYNTSTYVATLTETLANYDSVEIWVKNGSTPFTVPRTALSSGAAVTYVNTPAIAGNGVLYYKITKLDMSAKTITCTAKEVAVVSGSNIQYNDSTPVTITKVIAYKKNYA